MTQSPLDELRTQAMNIRRHAALQEQILKIDERLLGLPERHVNFARFVIATAYAAAAALDAAIEVHRETHAALGNPQPPSKPILRVVGK